MCSIQSGSISSNSISTSISERLLYFDRHESVRKILISYKFPIFVLRVSFIFKFLQNIVGYQLRSTLHLMLNY